MGSGYADRVEMQNRLFAELSRIFGEEVPLYDKSLAVNALCNRAVCDLLAMKHNGFAVSDAQLAKTSGERHGAIRIGREDEYRWVARFFACFGMEPHNFYDMTSVGAKSQPVIATAFRSLVHPEHRVFCSLLRPDYFDAETRRRIEAVLSERDVFGDAARALVEKCEAKGGLSPEDGDALIGEAVGRIFRWTGRARDFDLYTHLCGAGFKIAADIACFERHHLNHLTPNTFCMDLYTSAMKWRLGEIDEASFRRRAFLALAHVREEGGPYFLRLHFKHLTRAEVEAFEPREVDDEAMARLIEGLVRGLSTPELDLARLPHNGFKDSTEGPSWDTPILLRQDAYRALTEPVRFENPDGTVVEAEHTARFGEIEQRFYATTPAGRALYDECLASAMAAHADDPELAKRDYGAYERAYAAHFARIPKRLEALLEGGLVYARFEATAAGLARAGTIGSTDLLELARDGLVAYEGLRHEDFLPVSAAGIFASNLNQYGTKATADEKPTYTRGMLEAIMGRPIVDADAVCRGLQSESVLRTYADLGLLERVPAGERARMEAEAGALPEGAASRFEQRSVSAARA
jgi:uncharacterized glyoxalase superfamily metalloenzyme YdcJ